MSTSIVESLQKAITKAGGQKALADLISTPFLPVGQSTVSNWMQRNSVPADYCPAIERETGVPCEELAPHTDWAYLRGLVEKHEKAV